MQASVAAFGLLARLTATAHLYAVDPAAAATTGKLLDLRRVPEQVRVVLAHKLDHGLTESVVRALIRCLPVCLRFLPAMSTDWASCVLAAGDSDVQLQVCISRLETMVMSAHIIRSEGSAQVVQQIDCLLLLQLCSQHLGRLASLWIDSLRAAASATTGAPGAASWKLQALGLVRCGLALASQAARLAAAASDKDVAHQAGELLLCDLTEQAADNESPLCCGTAGHPAASKSCSRHPLKPALRIADILNATLARPQLRSHAASPAYAGSLASAISEACVELPARPDAQIRAWHALGLAACCLQQEHFAGTALAVMLRRSSESDVHASCSVLRAAVTAIWATVRSMVARSTHRSDGAGGTHGTAADASQLAPLLYQHMQWLAASCSCEVEASSGGALRTVAVRTTADAAARCTIAALDILGTRFAEAADKQALSKVLFSASRPSPAVFSASRASCPASVITGADCPRQGLGIGEAVVATAVSAVLACVDAASGRREIEDLERSHPASPHRAPRDTSDSESDGEQDADPMRTEGLQAAVSTLARASSSANA